MLRVDHTHDLKRESWVASAHAHSDFPLQNLPLGIFRSEGNGPCVGIAIGDEILRLDAVIEAGLLEGRALDAARIAAGPTLNRYMALSPEDRLALRWGLFDVLTLEGETGLRASTLGDTLLVAQSACTMCMPAEVGDYTDFFAGIHHASNAGRKLRSAQDPLWPNYLHVPIAYHGRSSSIEVSGAEIIRPKGQTLPEGAATPVFGPCRRLDYEFEFGVWIGGGNQRGHNIPISEAKNHIAGFCLLNDWSARDVQMWEAQPLGPFLAKNFVTTVSPWVVTIEALAPYFCGLQARPNDAPELLAYLLDDQDQAQGALDATLDAFLATERTRAEGAPPHRLSAANTLDLCWTFAQMVAHHTVGGCPLRAGDLFGTGTISGPTPAGFGSLFELTNAGTDQVHLGSEQRKFLEDGDEVILRAHCCRAGFATIGFGESRGRVVSASTSAPVTA